jgi:hypothetical protein
MILARVLRRGAGFTRGTATALDEQIDRRMCPAAVLLSQHATDSAAAAFRE